MRASSQSHLISALDSGARQSRQAALARDFEAAVARIGAKMRGEPEPTPEQIRANQAIDATKDPREHFDAVVKRARAKARREDPNDDMPSQYRRELGR